MKDCEPHVKAAIETPFIVCQDPRHTEIRVLYKPFILPKPYHTQYLRVAVKYKQRLVGGLRGYVLTAFPCTARRQRDIVIWQQTQ